MCGKLLSTLLFWAPVHPRSIKSFLPSFYPWCHACMWEKIAGLPCSSCNWKWHRPGNEAAHLDWQLAIGLSVVYLHDSSGSPFPVHLWWHHIQYLSTATVGDPREALQIQSWGSGPKLNENSSPFDSSWQQWLLSLRTSWNQPVKCKIPALHWLLLFSCSCFTCTIVCFCKYYCIQQTILDMQTCSMLILGTVRLRFSTV